MLHSMFRRVSPVLCLSALVLSAQDAGMVLRTSVSYGTERANPALTEEQRQQADDFGRQARQASGAQKYGDALRLYYQGFAVMRKVPWTPAMEFASALQAQLDHAMLEPGSTVTLTLKPLYTAPDSAKLSASVVIQDKSLADGIALDPAAVPFTKKLTLPELPAGDYTLQVRLSAGP